MGIDKLGKGGGTVPEVRLPDSGAAKTTATSPSAAFEVKPTAAPVAVAPVASPALEGVRNGSLDVRGYIDAKVHEATAHLSHLTPEQLETVRTTVREQIAADPHLIELVEQATGHIVPPENN